MEVSARLLQKTRPSPPGELRERSHLASAGHWVQLQQQAVLMISTDLERDSSYHFKATTKLSLHTCMTLSTS